jgi:peroxiredoxin
MDDKVHQLSDYRGTVVIINFWATWCPPCRAEMPSMQRAWTQLKKAGIVMLAINVGEKAAAIRRFHKEYPVGFPLLLDLDSSTAESWPMRGLPTTFVVDPAGRLAYKAVGGREWDNPEILDQIRALKGSRAQPPG